MEISMKRLSLVLLSLLLLASTAYAQNDIDISIGTGVTWTDSGGDEVLDLGDACGASAAVCVGAYHDWGADPRPGLYMMIVDFDGFDTAPVVGETIAVYISESQDASKWSGPEAPSDTADSTGDVDRLGNLLGPFIVTVHSTIAGDNLTNVFYFESYARYHAPVVHNDTADVLLTTADNHEIIIHPVVRQVQRLMVQLWGR